jgi:iron complex outermembrane receptor protein
MWASWAVANREPTRSNYTDAPIDGPLPQPEKLNDFETGYEYIGKNLQININGYYMLYDNQLILTGLINDVGSAIMTNVKDSYRAGIELSTKINILKNLTWEANTTLSQNKILNFTEYVDDWDNGGQIKFEHGTTDIAFSPALIANSNISFSANKSLTLSLVSHYVSDQYIDNSSSQNRKLDAYFVNNFKAGYALYPDFVDKIEISLQINNLLNAQYETNAWVYSYIFGGNRYKMDGYFPQAGTNFMFGINIDF